MRIVGKFSWLGVAALGVWLAGCGGHTARTLEMRTALDAGDAKGAVHALDKELDVDKPEDLPKDVAGDEALLVLDRASVLQSLANFKLSKRDFEAADKAIDMLDLARNAGDSIGEYIFSDSSGRYAAPPYEKLLINTLNMINYLETHDLSGARVEARRLSIMQKYYRDSLGQPNNPVLGLGSALAGFTYEKSGDTNEALRYYDEALEFAGFSALAESVRRLAPQGTYRSPRLRKLLESAPDAAESPSVDVDTGSDVRPDASETGDVLIVVGYGRVPHKISNRLPIGLVLTRFAWALSPNDVSTANELAAQGLVSWINFPSLGKSVGSYDLPSASVDGEDVALEAALDVEAQVRKEWNRIEGKIIASAITRLAARIAAGKGVEAGVNAAAGKKNGIFGVLASLALQGTLTALDTPDTRSWETLPARVAVARVRLPVGQHRVTIRARGYERKQDLVVTKDGWSVVSLMALR